MPMIGESLNGHVKKSCGRCLRLWNDIRRGHGSGSAVAKVGHRQHLTYNGYLRVGLSRNGKAKHCRVARLVAAAFIGECPSRHAVNHKDGIKTNNYCSNLEYVTWGENLRHARDVLGKHFGPQKGTCGRLMATQVHIVRYLLDQKHTQQVIADYFQVSDSTIGDIKRCDTWVGI